MPSDLQNTTPDGSAEGEEGSAEPGGAEGEQEGAAEPGEQEGAAEPGEQEGAAEPGEQEGAAEPGEQEGAAEPDGAEGGESAGPSDAAIAVRLESQRRSGSEDDTSAHSVRLVHPQTSSAVAAAVEAMVTQVLKKDYRAEMCLSFMGSLLTDRDIQAALAQPVLAGYLTALLGICRDIVIQDMLRDGQDGNGDGTADGEEDAGGENDSAELPAEDDITQPVRVPGD